jgi:glycosyltransferase involved in cell wall biosynthesis
MNNTHSDIAGAVAPLVSLGVFAWNEQETIARVLDGLLTQTLPRELEKRHARLELRVLVNGSTDATFQVATDFLREAVPKHPAAAVLDCRVVNLPARGKLNAWNRFVHELSHPEATYLCLLDADIHLHEPQTIWRLIQALQENPEAHVATDLPRKHFEFWQRRSLADRLSLAQAGVTRSAAAQLCGQLYCARARIARGCWMPRDLPACEDGFLKLFFCTNGFTTTPRPDRLLLVPGAEHTFEAYTGLTAVIRNQKRQVIGQTVVHLLADRLIPALPPGDRSDLAHALCRKDRDAPDWLKRAIADHVHRARHFWRLYPGLLGHRWHVARSLPWRRRWAAVPALAAATLLQLAGAWLAFRSLRAGTTNYWPAADRSSANAWRLAPQP